MGKIYALLVGINDYPPGTDRLQGCVNDVENVRTTLRDLYVDPAIEVLTDGDATYANVIASFRSHLGRAGKGDVAYFHYSGHGARSRAAAEFHKFDRDLRDQGLVCVDSRIGDNYDLADKELAVLIAELARNEPQIALLLDCCHSGTGTRDLEGAGTAGVRGTGEGNFPRRIETYLDGFYAHQLGKDGAIAIPQQRHILMAAADRDETAKEDLDTHRGIFTTALYDVLREGGSEQSYAELFVRTRARVTQYITRANKTPQRPQFETIVGFDGWTPFLGQGSRTNRSMVAGVSRAGLKPIMVICEGEKWFADVGAIAGLPVNPASPVMLDLASEAEPAVTLGSARVTRVGASKSEVAPQFAADPAQRYLATITSMPPMPLQVAFTGPAETRAAIAAVLAADPALRALLVEDGAPDDGFMLVMAGSRAQLCRRDDGQIAATIDWSDPATAAPRLLEVLGHVAQWRQLLGMNNPAPQLDPGQVEFLFARTLEGGGEELATAPAASLGMSRGSDGKWQGCGGEFRLRNQTGTPLYFALLHFSSDYGVRVIASDKAVSAPEPMTLLIDQGGGRAASKVFLWTDGDQQAVEQFKLVLASEPIDSFLLQLDPLTRDRGFGSEAEMKEALKVIDDDWFAVDLRIRVAPRLAAAGQTAASLAGGQVTVDPHGSVTADLALVTPLGPARATGADADPSAALAPAGLRPATLGGARGDGLAALDITGISDPAALRDNPLMLRLALPVEPGEVLVPMVRDGAHLLPAGDFWREPDGSTRLAISSVPAPMIDQRSVVGSLRLWFFKTVAGVEQVNRLRLATFDAQGKVQYGDSGAVRRAVQGGSKVLLAIHGIIGDTRAMLEGLHQSEIDAGFDCVLAYDYENLATAIDQTARQLAADLADVGLGADDGKQLTVLAHSMGGLVSRWLVEKEGGAATIDHLVMCGTPNCGSPFGEVGKARKVLLALFAIGTNFLPPFCGSIVAVLTASSQLTPTLEQMSPESEFVHALNRAAAPTTRYSIIAGDLAQYQAPDPAYFDGLITKIGRSAGFDLLFGGSRNDIAVKLGSILIDDYPGARVAARSTVGCHHLNYFSSPAGQSALQAVEWG